LGLAVSNFAGDPRCQTWPLGREVSNYLHSTLIDFMPPQTWADLAFLAVAKGPGSFTGTRLGVVTARTLAQQLDLPLFAVSTLAALAWNAAKSDASTDIAVQMLAQRGEIYGAIYSTGNSPMTTLLPDTVMSLQQWQQLLESWNRPYRLVWAEAELGATAASVLELAYQDWQLGQRPHWSAALPFYGQSPV
jgi:tRNA threonylcarbamoyl adenosine modification protein YeaZ